MKKIISKSENATQEVAQDVAKDLIGGDALALIGDLGGGKTTFTKGLASYFGVSENIQSPTFNIIKEYSVDKNGIKKIYHMDFYRVKNDNELFDLGLEEIFSKKDSISIIEWADIGKTFLPKGTKYIEFDFMNDKTRKIVLK